MVVFGIPMPSAISVSDIGPREQLSNSSTPKTLSSGELRANSSDILAPLPLPSSSGRASRSAMSTFLGTGFPLHGRAGRH
jgi:hypothetical protein